jgi:hypothetical protein
MGSSALILAVLSRTILEPVTARKQIATGDGAVAKERQQLMEAIARSVF